MAGPKQREDGLWSARTVFVSDIETRPKFGWDGHCFDILLRKGQLLCEHTIAELMLQTKITMLMITAAKKSHITVRNLKKDILLARD